MAGSVAAQSIPLPSAQAGTLARVAAGGDPFVLAAPGAGERISVPVAPGQPVALPDQAFDPGSSRYVIDGRDLVVMPPNGGVIVFAGFFGHPADPPTLSVLGGPPVSANELLARAELAAGPQALVVVAAIPVPDATDTGAGPGSDRLSAGGGAGFAPYDPGDLGPGLAPTGPLGPTALVYGAEFPQLDGAFGDRGGDDRAAAPPPGPGAPLQPPGLPELPAPPEAPPR